MISTLIEKNNIYYCSNCMMRQPQLRPNCWWCGNMFSNYEETAIKEANDNIKKVIIDDPGEEYT